MKITYHLHKKFWIVRQLIGTKEFKRYLSFVIKKKDN